MNSIPVYRPDGSLYDLVSVQRLTRLQTAGLVARVVRHRKGHVNRAILFIRPGEPKPLAAGALAGSKYSFKETLEHGQAWELKRLGDSDDEKAYAPAETRTMFEQVVRECMR
jgi:hypothetical protein